MIIFDFSCPELLEFVRVNKLVLALSLPLCLKLASLNIELVTYSNNED